MSRKQLEDLNVHPPTPAACSSRPHAMVNPSRLLVLLTGVMLMACGQVNTPGQDMVEVPFFIEDVPADAPVRHVSVKYPLDWEPRTLAAREYRGFLVYDNAILGKVGEVPEADETTLRAQALPSGRTWQNKTITYSVGNLSPEVARTVRDAADYYNEKTVVQWVEAASGTTGMVKFSSNNKDGSSGVTHRPVLDSNGNITSVSIELSSAVYPSTVRHEMLHALGFAHEQKRPDRDAYLNVSNFAANDSAINYGMHPIGHYDLVSKVHYDYSDDPKSSGYFQFELRDDDKVRTLFQREARKYHKLPEDPPTTSRSVRKYVGKGDDLSYLDIYALQLKYTVLNSNQPFVVTAVEEKDAELVKTAKLASGQKLLRLAIKNNSGFDAESWALRIQFAGATLPVRLAPLGVQKDGFLTPVFETEGSATRKQAIITPMEGNSRITNGKTLYVYVVMNTGANGQLDGMVFCRINSFQC